MANKTFQGRIVQKHDTEANWKKATNFVPLKGEIIVYDDLNKIKIGDGSTKINDLKFDTATFYVKLTQGANNSATADKDLLDIYNAYLAGYEVNAIVSVNNFLCILPLAAVDYTEMDGPVLAFSAIGSTSSDNAPSYLTAFGYFGGWNIWSGNLIRDEDLATVATSGSYNDLINKPTIPSISGLATETYVNTKVAGIVNSAPETLDTLQELASALGNDPNFATTMATQIGKKANSADLATVAKTGSYSDLKNKPTIPSVGNGTLTIQKNGTSAGTFTANATTNKTINITVPTKVSELTDDVVNGKYLPLIGGTMTGNLKVGSSSLETNGYVTGTWLRTTADTSLGSAASKIAVINNGWIYSRTAGQIKSDIGLGNVDNVKQYSATNPPPYPVTSVNGHTGAVTVHEVPSVTTADNGKFLRVISGEWTATTAPNKFTFTATADQSTFTIPFDFEDSSALTVYYNGVMMKETDNYTVSGKVITLAGFTAEAGDYLTVMGIEGAAAIDFGQEAIDAIAQMNTAKSETITAINNIKSQASTEINTVKSQASTEINTVKSNAITEINNLVATLPSDTSSLMFLNKTNTMTANGKITMDSTYTPSANGDVATKQYVDNHVPDIDPPVGTSTNYAIYIGSTAPASGTTPLLWIDTTASTGTFKYRTSTTGTWKPVPVAWS